MKSEALKRKVEEYQDNLLSSLAMDQPIDQAKKQQAVSVEDRLEELKALAKVPNRKEIKAQSAKLVEELSKKKEF